MRAAVAVPFEETDPATVAPLLTFFEKCFTYLEIEFVGRLVVPGVTARGEVRRHPEYLREATLLGQRLGR
jgi:hypothetical protein